MAKAAKRKTKVKIYPFDAAETLDTPEAIEEFLIAALETGDAAFIAKSIGIAARAAGMSKIAKKAGLSRENLYRSLNGRTKVELETVVRTLSALGIELTARLKAASLKAA
jgi:probable addiction module antidote protein